MKNFQDNWSTPAFLVVSASNNKKIPRPVLTNVPSPQMAINMDNVYDYDD